MEYNYLSESLTANDCQLGKLNLISSPTGTGKTTFAINELTKLARFPNHVVYLIDTNAGQDQLVKHHEGLHLYDKAWREYLQDGVIHFQENRVCVMTYAKFGTLIAFYPQFTKELELVVCDELHSLFWTLGAEQERGDNYSSFFALNTLVQLVKGGKCYVVSLTSTPRQVWNSFPAPVYDLTNGLSFVDRSPLHRYTYQNLDTALEKMEHGKHYLIYIQHISRMKECVELLRSRGFRAEALWSMHRADQPMSEEQLALRTYIMEHEQMPNDLDVLIINTAYETCINLRGEIEAAFIHTSNEDVITQACGRYRGRLNALYVYSQEGTEIDLTTPFLNVPLFTEDKQRLAEQLNLRNKCGRLCKWTTIKRRLLEQGYSIQEGKQSKRFSIITPPPVEVDS